MPARNCGKNMKRKTHYINKSATLSVIARDSHVINYLESTLSVLDMYCNHFLFLVQIWQLICENCVNCTSNLTTTIKQFRIWIHVARLSEHFLKEMAHIYSCSSLQGHRSNSAVFDCLLLDVICLKVSILPQGLTSESWAL